MIEATVESNGQQTPPKRPKGSSGNATQVNIWVDRTYESYRLFNSEGIMASISPEIAEGYYGVHIPQPEATPEDAISSAIGSYEEASKIIEKLREAGFQITFEPNFVGVNCVNCGRPLLLNEDNSLYLDEEGEPWHSGIDSDRGADTRSRHVRCNARFGDHLYAKAPQGFWKD